VPNQDKVCLPVYTGPAKHRHLQELKHQREAFSDACVLCELAYLEQLLAFVPQHWRPRGRMLHASLLQPAELAIVCGQTEDMYGVTCLFAGFDESCSAGIIVAVQLAGVLLGCVTELFCKAYMRTQSETQFLQAVTYCAWTLSPRFSCRCCSHVARSAFVQLRQRSIVAIAAHTAT
jgi:hypothetical protein